MESMDGIDGMEDVSDSKSNGGSSALVYESADEKLSEWDLAVSLMGSLSDTSKLSEGVIDTQTKRTNSIPITTAKTLKSETRGLVQESMSTSKELKQHLKALRENEKTLKRDLEIK